MDSDFGNLIETARSEHDWKNMRTYIAILGEYSSYMTEKQKLMTLKFLYEQLADREGDIRSQSAAIMSVPFGKALADVVVPNTVTKALHTEKYFDSDLNDFTIAESRYYSALENQVRTIKSFDRPVILIDDLLHKGYRMNILDPLMRENEIDMKEMIVGVMTGNARDFMREAPLEKITVRQITDRCGVSRQTFYRNFTDKYDLINWYFDELLIKAFEHMRLCYVILMILSLSTTGLDIMWAIKFWKLSLRSFMNCQTAMRMSLRVGSAAMSLSCFSKAVSLSRR